MQQCRPAPITAGMPTCIFTTGTTVDRGCSWQPRWRLLLSPRWRSLACATSRHRRGGLLHPARHVSSAAAPPNCADARFAGAGRDAARLAVPRSFTAHAGPSCICMASPTTAAAQPASFERYAAARLRCHRVRQSRAWRFVGTRARTGSSRNGSPSRRGHAGARAGRPDWHLARRGCRAAGGRR